MRLMGRLAPRVRRGLWMQDWSGPGGSDSALGQVRTGSDRELETVSTGEMKTAPPQASMAQQPTLFGQTDAGETYVPLGDVHVGDIL